ncbi:carboxypeptidase A1 precursor [Sporormia fimetaria CBS 119925]|uniref:Carboxypeptidase A1 n=1 Tax=Sporormia fimetaria CBS 119925 TaxID=1340428 RepID=A0A6A6VBW4_9PLEO|nr:carboxypeptidase A1 precursor [Sporormia fimetaria CBS 119925]
MKLLPWALASFGAASAVSVASKVSYDGWKVFRVNVGSKHTQFRELVNAIGLETWKGKPGGSQVVDVMVAPSQLAAWETAAGDFEFDLMHDNLGKSISVEGQFPVYTANAASDEPYAAPENTWFDTYHPIADHMQFLGDLAASHPNNSEVFVAGLSHEGRDIKGIHIWGNGGKGSKPAVVWHGTVHAREWVTTMVVEYAAYQLLESTDAKASSFKDKYDFYIIPVVNPDGFAFSQSTDRMWRKNRQATPSASCVGRDINRNWPNQWNQSTGASTSPCAQDYKGPSAGDGTETKVLKAHLDSVAAESGLAMYMDIHSYSQLWMYPYGYTCSGVVPEAAKYESLSQGAVAAIESVHGMVYEAGPICQTIYEVSGDSVDYAYEVAKANYSMTVELRDTGRYGFILPPEQIRPTAEEMWAGLSYVLDNM